MIGRPTTEQLLRDCCRVLETDVLPAVADETTQVRLVMLAKVLGNAAVRAAHEIAWMREETVAVEGYGAAVLAATGDPALRAALAALADGPAGSLHLADVTEVYGRAGEALSTALEAALASGREDLVRDGESLLAARLAHEDEIVGGWDSAGR
ncbi:hypothetical protein ACI797_05285 [Geodermatophilus sp. SYSU D00691]